MPIEFLNRLARRLRNDSPLFHTTTDRTTTRRRKSSFFRVERLEQRQLLTASVSLEVDLHVGTEAAMTVVMLTATVDEPVTGAQTVDVVVSGTGITAGDYSLSSSQITIPHLGTNGTATFTIQDDSLFEGAETATIAIVSPSAGITIGATYSHPVAIIDDVPLDQAIDDVLNQTVARQNQALQAQLANTFPSSGIWFHTNFALAAYWLNEQTASADAGLITVHTDGLYDDDVANDGFHWRAYQLERIYFLFSSQSRFPEFQGRMSTAAEDAVLEMLWDWSAPITKIGMASPEKLNFYWGSENHDAQAWVSFWGAAHIFKDHPDYQNRTYADGSTPAAMAAAFDNYFTAYARSHTLKGLPIEVASPTYAKYTLNTWLNLFDFAEDPELREAAGALLDIYWADWAQEHIDGVRGGSRHRSYPGRESISSSGGGEHAWYALGQGIEASKHPGAMSGATTFWRPSRAVVGLTLDVQGRGSYGYTSRRLGLKDQAPPNEPPALHGGSYNPIDAEGGSLLRYTWTTPDFVMGMTQVEARPWEDWLNISSQNRWNGITFGGHDTARIFTQRPYPGNNRSVYNEEWGVQNKGAMILQRLSTDRSATGQMIWFDFALSRQESGGWIFAEAPGAYTAVKVVHSGWTWQPDTLDQHRSGTDLTVGEWAVLNDQFSPIILEVGRKQDYADIDAFKAEILGNAIAWDGTELSYTSTGYDTTLTHFADESAPPQVDGTPLNFTPTEVYDSPYLQGDFGNGVVIVDYGDDRTVHGVTPFVDDTDTVALWHFDEALSDATGTFYADDTSVTSRPASAARERDTSEEDISVIADGKFGSALRFDFADGDQYMITPSSLWPADEGTFRFQGWFRLNPGDSGGYLAHVYDQVYLSVNASTATFAVNKSGDTSDTSSTNLVTVSADISTSNQWQYIDALYDGASIQLVTEVETNSAAGNGPFVPNVRNIYVGSRKNKSNFVGDMDEVKISAPESVVVPDLVATAFDAVSDHVLNGQTDVTVTVENTATVAAGAFDTHVVWSANNILGDSDDMVVSGSEATFTGVAAGADETKTISLQLDRAALYANAMMSDAAGESVGTVSTNSSRLFLVIDINNDVIENDETNNSGQGHFIDSDDITYFPWDTNGNGTVTPIEALHAIQAINTADATHDFDGNGIVTPLEALSVLQRIGYQRNDDVFGDAPAAANAATSVASAPTGQSSVVGISQLEPALPGTQTNPSQTFASPAEDDDEEDSLFRVESSDRLVMAAQSADDSDASNSEAFTTTKWLDVI